MSRLPLPPLFGGKLAVSFIRNRFDIAFMQVTHYVIYFMGLEGNDSDSSASRLSAFSTVV